MPQLRSGAITKNAVDDACDKVTDTVEDVMEKGDSIVLKRAMRFVDHAPMLYTLKKLAEKAGWAAEKWSVDAPASAFTGLDTAMAVPAWCFNIWTLIAVTQVASVVKSALAEDSNELSQRDISTSALATFMATRAIGSENLLLNTGLTALFSGYALRNGGDGSVTIHKAAMQLMASFTTVLTVLGAIPWVINKLPDFSASGDVVSVLGIVAYYLMATRGANGTAKKAVNAGVIGGILYARLADGINFSLKASSIVPGITLVGTAYLAYEAINRLRKAVMD